MDDIRENILEDAIAYAIESEVTVAKQRAVIIALSVIIVMLVTGYFAFL